MTARAPERLGRCAWHARHWFAYYGMPGSSAPVCVRNACDAPNPNYDPDRDPHAGHDTTRGRDAR